MLDPIQNPADPFHLHEGISLKDGRFAPITGQFDYRVFNPDCSIARVTHSRRSINREKNLFDMPSTDINTTL
jgi:hypothetical protein